MESYAQGDLRNSIYDGVFANMFATLTGGVFLTAFALHLGMNEFMIGLLGSIPFVATFFQLPTSFFIRKNGKRKNVAYWAAAFARLLWIPILVSAMLPITPSYTKCFLILGLIFVSHTFISISYVSWLSWTSELIPDKIRGRFFGTRNMLCGAAGTIVMLVFGKILDKIDGGPTGNLSLGFITTFVSAVFFGMLSLRFLNKVSDPQHGMPSEEYVSFQDLTRLPLKEHNFRRFLIFAFLWSFSVYFASPFFTLYFLRELNFSYAFVATLGVLSTLADLTGMQIWGRISDKVKNKAVIRLSGWVAIFLPMAWATIRPSDVFMPILLQIIGGGFWAGINLCMNNLLLRISPQQNRAFFLSAYNVAGGVGAALGPIFAGFALKYMGNLELQLLSWEVFPLHIIFAASTVFRLLSFQLFRYVREPEEVTVGQMVRILRSVRGLNMANGFNYPLHPFIEIPGKKQGS